MKYPVFTSFSKSSTLAKSYEKGVSQDPGYKERREYGRNKGDVEFEMAGLDTMVGNSSTIKGCAISQISHSTKDRDEERLGWD
jgi:hypothetical protein